MSTAAKTPTTRLQGRRTGSGRMSQTDEIPQKFVWTYLSIVTVILVVSLVGFFKFHKSIIHLPRMTSIIDRLNYTLQMQVFNLIPLFVTLGLVIYHRMVNGAINPLSGHDVLIEKPIRIMTNTVEQTLMAALSQLTLASYISSDYMFMMPFLVTLYVIGRFLFIVGYMIHPKYRGFGFVTTMSSNFIAFTMALAYGTGLNRIIHSSGFKPEL